MNIKSITTLGLVAVALAVTSLTPAEAKGNNNQAMNQLAMQYYMQNQSAANTNSVYNQAMAADQMMHPAAYGYYNNAYGAVNPYVSVNPYAAAIPNYGCNTGYNTGVYNNRAYGNVISQYPRQRAHEGHWRHFGR